MTNIHFIFWHYLLFCYLHPIPCSALGSSKGQVVLPQILLITTWSRLRLEKQSFVSLLTISHKTWSPNSPLLYICLLLDNSVLIRHCPFYIRGTRTKKCTQSVCSAELRVWWMLCLHSCSLRKEFCESYTSVPVKRLLAYTFHSSEPTLKYSVHICEYCFQWVTVMKHLILKHFLLHLVLIQKKTGSQ